MSLTPEQITARQGKLTASRIAVLMNGDEADILNLWRELTGQPFDEPDLSGVWPVQLGSITEPLNLAWFARKNGPISRIGDVVQHKSGDYAATLDAWSDDLMCPVECKHVGGFESLETIIDRYQPQMHWQMILTQATRCALSVIMGASEPIVEIIEYDPEYGLELQTRAAAFMAHVRARTSPVILPAIAPPIIPTREVDMSASNEWGSAAAAWMEHSPHVKPAKDAESELKKLMPDDAKLAAGAGIKITRNRAGSMSLREQTK